MKGLLLLSVFIAGCFARSVFVIKINDLESSSDASSNDRQLKRQKRQFGFGGDYFGPQNYGQSSAQANANAFNQYYGPDGFGASSSLAGAQAFNSQSPYGDFGASAAHSGSQGFYGGPDGFGANAGFSGSQSYNLPNGQNLALSYGSGYNYVPGEAPQITNSNSIAFT
ncbi:CLUMA_CG010061, isoform A [Clunio marinus]|uniref:CLUMA_CG010061, isoform A n=1 Tax=Clunio marinus TaxID=568069 RepID=A0A1J1ICF1_9DIPT|nr:CLUMA_CG010061, isoform A [Clunio marinus]